MNNTPEELYVEQDIADGCVYEHWYDSDKVPIGDGARLIKYIHNDKYQKAIEALKYICKPIEHKDANLALYVRQEIAERTLKKLEETK